MFVNIDFLKTDVNVWPVNIGFLKKTDVNVNIILLTSVLYGKPMLDLHFKLYHTQPILLALSSSPCNLPCFASKLVVLHRAEDRDSSLFVVHRQLT